MTAAGARPHLAGRLSRSWLVIGGLLVAGILFAAFLGLGRDVMAISLQDRLQPPGPAYPLGTDQYGRDYLARVGSGTRVSLTIALMGTGVAGLGGLLAAGVGKALGRWGTALLAPRVAVPALLGPLAAGVVGVMVYGPNIRTLILVLGLASVPAMAQGFRILLGKGGEGLAGAAGMLVLTFAQILLVEQILSFAGFGVQPPLASLGWLMQEAMQYVRPHPYLLWGGVPGVVGMAGLFLVGHALVERSGE